MTHTARTALLSTAITLLATPALAHPGHSMDVSFVEGLMHPILGTDHLFAIVSTAVIAATQGGRAQSLIPITFLGFMAIGGAMGMAGVMIPFVESAIALTVLVLTMTIALDARPAFGVLIAMSALFASVHGCAHGAELPADSNSILFGAGFLSGTTLLLVLGVGVGHGLRRLTIESNLPRRAFGLATAAAGVTLIFQ